MANRYCVHCGARLDESMRFCPSCGKSVWKESDAAAEAPTAPSAMPGTTAVMTPVQGTAQPTSFSAPTSGKAPKSSDGLSPTAKGVIIGTVVGLAIIGLLLLIFVFHPWAPSSVESSTATATSESTANQPTSSSTSGSSSTSTSDATVFSSLTSAYSRLSGFDDRVRECAVNYNGTYTVTDMSVRTTNANACKALRTEIKQEMTALADLNVPSSSKYYQDLKNVGNLQNDLYQRVDVLIQAWDIDLTYATPSEHASEINAPIAAENDSSGTNIYKADYVSKYASSKPVEK